MRCSSFWPIRSSLAAAMLAAGIALSPPAAAADAARPADEIQEVTRLLRAGNHAQALDRVNAHLNANPKDARARFLKGLILTEQGKPGDAIKMFQALTEDFPELPEPYNNLAVLYAAQGQYDKARAALEMAIRTHPSYATAHENLGDIYAKLASQAYDKALQLDKSNAAAQTKLELIRDLFSGGPRPSRPAGPAAKADAPRIALAPAAPAAPASPPAPPAASKPAVLSPPPGTAPAPGTGAQRPAAEAAKAAPAAKPADPAPVAKPAEPAPAAKPAVARAEPAPAAAPAKPAEADTDEVLKAVNGWAQAWGSSNVKSYLAHYSPAFQPQGMSRTEWEAMRRSRIEGRKIELGISDANVTMKDASHAVVTFRQNYKASDMKRITSSKTLVLAKSDGRWLIQQEQVGK